MTNPLRKVFPLLAAGLILLALTAYAAQSAPTDRPAHVSGIVKSIDAKAQTFVLESGHPGFGGHGLPGAPGSTQGMPGMPQGQPGGGQGTFLRGEESAASDNTPITVSTTKATQLYSQSPGTLKDCAVGKWARIMKPSVTQGEASVLMVTLLPEALAASETQHQGAGPGPGAGPQGQGQNAGQGQGAGPRMGELHRGNVEIGKITNLKPFTIKLKDGTEKPVAVTEETRIVKTTVAAFGDIKVGKRVMVVGKRLADGGIEATQIMVQPDLKKPEQGEGGPGQGGQTPPPQ
jgi:hypothetical protein